MAARAPGQIKIFTKMDTHHDVSIQMHPDSLELISTVSILVSFLVVDADAYYIWRVVKESKYD